MRKRASITVFSALAFALVASFLMALLEAGRVYQIQTYADMKSALALESVCAEYQPVLWEEFHLLGLDGAYGGDTFSMDHVTAVLRERLDRNLDVDGAGGKHPAGHPCRSRAGGIPSDDGSGWKRVSALCGSIYEAEYGDGDPTGIAGTLW